MTIWVSLGDWETQRSGAQPLRLEVFVLEQHVPLDLEWDEMDAVSVHALACTGDGSVVGTGRLLPDGHLGRMAVRRDMRRRGVGSAILLALMGTARRRGDRSVVLSAQIGAAPFYERFGFLREGSEFIEAGIPHVQMRHDFGGAST